MNLCYLPPTLLLLLSLASETTTVKANSLRKRALNPLLPLEDIGDDGIPSTAYPLGECQGDCDGDEECEFGLVCFQRDGIEAVTGCTGTGTSGKDYCAKPEPGQLVLTGNNGSPSAVFAAGLGECEGDCDSDADCRTGLKCFQRADSTPVPGCSGEGVSGYDYCYQPPTLEVVGNDDELSQHELQICQGDCDTDYDCAYGLVCFQRRTSVTIVPGCEGTVVASTDYCIEPPNESTLVLVGNDGSPTEAFAGGLGMCEGDCDSDSDCKDGLKCFQRSDNTPVPGCSGDGASGSDYCYLDSSEPTLAYVGNNGDIAANSLGECQGDCDADSDCQSGLYCYQKSSLTSTVPGCDGTDSSSTDYCAQPWLPLLEIVGDDDTLSGKLDVCQGDCDSDRDCKLGLICDQRHDDERVKGCLGDAIDGKDYCIVPPHGGWLVKVGNNGSPAAAFPLGMCQGDCDDDSECEGNLICRQRDSYEVVPGCEGFGISGTDYCGPVPSPGAKRIIAIGDLHGDVQAARNALQLAGVLDNQDNWIGGETQVVQTGDQLDRGDTERQILDLFEDLRLQAQAAGGAFYPLIGNHEAWNVELNFVDVRNFAEFDNIPYDTNDSLIMGFPQEERGRAAAFRPGGPYAKILSEHSVILTLEGSLFVHGGVLPAHVNYGIAKINQEISDWMRGDAPQPDTSEIEDETHPMWSRHYSDEPDDKDCALLEEVLQLTGMDRMVVGHTIQWDDGIHSDCGGKIWKIDVGLSSVYDSSRVIPEAQVLEIVGDVVTVISG